MSPRTVRAARTRRARACSRVQIRRRIRPTSRAETGSRASHGFLEETSRCYIQILPSHHRVFDVGAVLSVVNALRFASTRPTARPSGIDDASARHDLGFCAMAGFLVAPAGRENEAERTRLTRDFGGRMLVSRVCAAWHILRIAHSACRARFQSLPSGHDSSAPPQHRVRPLRSHAVREPAHTRSRSRGLSSTRRLEDQASLRVTFAEAHARPCLGRTRRR